MIFESGLLFWATLYIRLSKSHVSNRTMHNTRIKYDIIVHLAIKQH